MAANGSSPRRGRRTGLDPVSAIAAALGSAPSQVFIVHSIVGSAWQFKERPLSGSVMPRGHRWNVAGAQISRSASLSPPAALRAPLSGSRTFGFPMVALNAPPREIAISRGLSSNRSSPGYLARLPAILEQRGFRGSARRQACSKSMVSVISQPSSLEIGQPSFAV